MTNTKFQLIDIMLRVFQKYVYNMKIARSYGAKDKLFPAEIHMLMHIDNQPGAGITTLAEITGVTKGAVSQMVGKLESKGYVAKKIDQNNRRARQLFLTPKGKRANETHTSIHKKEDRELLEFLDNLPDKKINDISTFFKIIEKGMDKRLEK